MVDEAEYIENSPDEVVEEGEGPRNNEGRCSRRGPVQLVGSCWGGQRRHILEGGELRRRGTSALVCVHSNACERMIGLKLITS